MNPVRKSCPGTNESHGLTQMKTQKAHNMMYLFKRSRASTNLLSTGSTERNTVCTRTAIDV